MKTNLYMQLIMYYCIYYMQLLYIHLTKLNYLKMIKIKKEKLNTIFDIYVNETQERTFNND